MSHMTATPPVVTMPEDAYVYTMDDDLSTADVPAINGTGDQTDGLGAL